VDWSNIRGNVVAVGGGVITRIYQGLSGFGTTVIETLSGGTEVYYAGETGAGAPVVTPGQAVRAGDPIAPGLGTGGIEVGYWNPATGRALGAPDYTGEGVQTPAGQSFRSAISSGGTSAGQTSTLGQLWIQAGGDPRLANIMAAIAMAESGGRANATNSNTNGSTDRGLWQINSVHSQFDAQRLLTDPLYNAQAAVAIEKSQGLGAWTTYTSGAYKSFLNSASRKPTYTLPRPGGGNVGGPPASDIPGVLNNYARLRDMPRTAPPGTKNPAQWFLASFTGNWGGLGGGASGGATPPAV
jgi:hypothetical protein